MHDDVTDVQYWALLSGESIGSEVNPISIDVDVVDNDALPVI